MTAGEVTIRTRDSERLGFLRRLLQGLLVVLVLATLASVAINGWSALRFPDIAINLLLAAVIGLSLWLLHRGNFATVVWMVAGVLYLASLDVLRLGLTSNGAGPMLLFAPVTLVGLLLGRRALLISAAVAAVTVAGVYYLEVIGSPLLMEPSEVPERLATLVIFGLMLVLIAIFLDRFALTLREALDRSEEREAELRREIEERRRLEAWLHVASDAAGVGLWSWDLASGELEWSPKMREQMGVPADSPVTLDTFRERVHPDDREAVDRSITELRVGDMLPFRVVGPDGSLHWFTGRGSSMNGGKRFVGAVFDITRLMEAEEERARLLRNEQQARESAERLGRRLGFLAEASHLLSQSLEHRETLTQLAQLAVPQLADWCAIDLLTDDNRLERVVVTHTDPAKVEFAHEIYRRYPPQVDAATGAYRVLESGEAQFFPEVGEELLRAVARDDEHFRLLQSIGFSSAIVVPLISRGRALGVLTMVYAESGRHYDEEDFNLVRQLGERAALAVDNALLYGDSRSLNRQLDQRVRARTAELEAANAELESFTYSASHDLRTPLRGIAGFSHALLEDYGDRLDETGREYLQRIASAANRMGQIIDDLLKLSRVTRVPIQRESVDLSQLAREVVAELSEGQGKRDVEVRIQEGLTAQGDVGLVKIALENLLSNAWKFTSRRKDALIEFAWDVEQEAFFVRDNGAGFDMQYASKLFQPFQRLHGNEEYGGTGVGLATTKRVMERLGGLVWAESQPGRGATFYFQLPRD